MKNKTLLHVSVLILSMFAFAGCSKDDDKPASVNVEYQITPMNVHFTRIAYTDKNGSTVTINNFEEFVDGKRSISVTKPFNAKLETDITNVTNETLTYSLVISVNGTPKKVVPASIPPQATITTTAEYTVE